MFCSGRSRTCSRQGESTQLGWCVAWASVHVKKSHRQENMEFVMLKRVLRILEVNRILTKIALGMARVCSGTTIVVWDFLAAAVPHS